MLKRCGECKNLKAIKENGQYVIVCTVTNNIHNVIDKVICCYYKPVK